MKVQVQPKGDQWYWRIVHDEREVYHSTTPYADKQLAAAAGRAYMRGIGYGDWIDV